MIQGDFPDIRVVGQQQGGMALHGLALGGVVGILAVARHASALVSAEEIVAALRTDARLQALVYVCRQLISELRVRYKSICEKLSTVVVMFQI